MSPLYGPFSVLDLSAAPTVTTDATTGQTITTYPPATGVHYTADAPTYARNAAMLAPYLVHPTHPLQFVMAGDDPAVPTNTYPLVFPDQATADQVTAQLV